MHLVDLTETVMLVVHLQWGQLQLGVVLEEGEGKKELLVPMLVMVLEALEANLQPGIKMGLLVLTVG